MTFGTYAKRQVLFEPELNTWFTVAKPMPDESGVLKYIRIRYIISSDFTDDFDISLRLVDYYDNAEVIDTSNTLTLADFVKPVTKAFHQGWIRFDFTGNKSIATDNRYVLQMIYNCSVYNTTLTRFIMFPLDSPLKAYETTGSDDPFTNGYIEHQIFTERLYDDFVIR
jgi:hypothetical protein